MKMKGLKTTATASGAHPAGPTRGSAGTLVEEWTSLVQRKRSLLTGKSISTVSLAQQCFWWAIYSWWMFSVFTSILLSFSPKTAKQESGKVYQSTPTTDNQDIFWHDWRILERWTSSLFPVGSPQNELYVPLIVLNPLSFDCSASEFLLILLAHPFLFH